MLTIDLSPELEKRLAALARATGRTEGEHAVEALADYLADLEDAQLAQQRLAEIRAGRSDTVPLEDVLKRHGLAD